jgi:ferredoxin
MKQKHLKLIRLIVSLFFLTSLSAIFLDFREFIPTEWVHQIHAFQFVPSLLNFINAAGITAAGFIIVIILTLLFGRVYCSTLCPLGILQDVFSFISRRSKIRKRYKFTRPLNIVRYGFLVLAVASLIFGSILTLYLLDPYSNFGRIFSGLIRPGVIGINNLLAGLFEKINWFFLYRFDVQGFDWKEALFPAFMLGLVIWLSFFHGRLFCNTVCPVGTLLGFLSGISVFRLKMDNNSCTRCGKCSVVCKSSCIDVKKMEVDVSRCVDCYNCLKVCPSVSIQYKPSFFRKRALEPDASKRDFISKSILYMMALAGLSRKSIAQDNANSKTNLIPVKKENPVSPPGSISLSHFNHYCTACHLCVSTCPSQVLQPSFLEYGFTGILQPHMDFAVNFCEYECTKCGEVCPSGAILPLLLENKKLIQIGKVHFILKNCVVFTDETSCGSCAEHCPTQAVHMIPYKNGLTIPETRPSTCIGCGACEHVCPVKPYKAIYVDGNPVHKSAKKPEFEEMKETEIEEFPF